MKTLQVNCTLNFLVDDDVNLKTCRVYIVNAELNANATLTGDHKTFDMDDFYVGEITDETILETTDEAHA